MWRSLWPISVCYGSYEPSQTVVVVEPSRVTINQHPVGAAPAVQAAAACLLIRTGSVEVAEQDGLDLYARARFDNAHTTRGGP